jgi:transposase
MALASKKRSRADAFGPDDPLDRVTNRRLQPPSAFDMLQFLKSMEEVQLPRLRRKKEPVPRIARPYTVAQQAFAIYLRFGTIRNDSKPWLSCKEVFLRTGIKPTAQANMIKRWRKRGFQVVSHLKRRGVRKILNEQQLAYIRNPKILRDWSHLSLYQRTQLIKAKFGLQKMDPTTLRTYYNEAKIKYRKPQISYAYKEKNLRAIGDQQQQFSKELATLLMQGTHDIVYIDETSFHLWQQPGRCWLKRDMALTLPTTRGRSITVIGALSEERGLFHCELITETNTAQTFSRFIAGLKQKCRRPTMLVMDNLSVHKARSVMQLYDERFQVMFLPTYSSVLNPIERVWNLMKHEWRKTQHMHALLDFEDEDRRTLHSLARIRQIIGKQFSLT